VYLESSRHQLLDSGIKNKVFYLKISIWSWPDLGDAIQDQTNWSV